MRNKSLLLSMFALILVAFTATGCPGGGDDDDDGSDNGGTPDASVSLPDANQGGAPDAAPMAENAADLGKICMQGGAGCPVGYICLFFAQGATNGMCTPICGSGMTPNNAVCTNMFPGPGTGQCALGLMGSEDLVCAIRCTNAAPACPTGNTCQDLFNAQGMAGMDGMLDLCVPN